MTDLINGLDPAVHIPHQQQPEFDIDPPKESKREAFVRLCDVRMNKILRDLHKLGKLGDRSRYDIEDDDLTKIETKLEVAIQVALDRLRPDKPDLPLSFSLEEPT